MKYFYLFVALAFTSCNDTKRNTKRFFDDTLSHLETTNKYQKVISDSTNVLEQSIHTLELEFILWGCACPNWISKAERIECENNDSKRIIDYCIFIEPADVSLKEPDSTFQFGEENILVTGSFYVKKDYSKGTVEQEEPLPKARVFRFTKIEIVPKNRNVKN